MINVKIKLLIFCLCTLFLFSNIHGQRKLQGIYQSNFAINGFFIEMLTLNCDSTFILNFKGDLQNRNTYGKWHIINKKLFLINDSIKSFSFGYIENEIYIL